MPQKKEKKTEAKKKIDIFALIFPKTNSVYVGISTYKRHCDLFYNHYRGRHAVTKTRVKEHLENGECFQLFILNSFTGIKAAAYQDRLAWYKYFITNGLSVECEKSTKDILSDFDGRALDIFQKIKNYPIADVLDPEKNIAVRYKNNAKNEEKNPDGTRYTVRFTPEEYETIKKKAETYEMSINDLMISSALKSVVKKIELDVKPVVDCIDKIDALGNSLDALITTIILSGVYFPADIAEIKNIENSMIVVINDLKDYFVKTVCRIISDENRWS